tara:strand:- start:641 stop:865 length:225 start_codon:yes stop_codon:yes gene_type:complete
MKNTKNQKLKIKIAQMSFFIFSQKLASLINEANNIKLDDFKKYYQDLISYIRIIQNENKILKNENKILKSKLKF